MFDVNGESYRGFDSNGSSNTPALPRFEYCERTAKNASSNSEPTQGRWQDTDIRQKRQKNSENDSNDARVESSKAALLVDVALHGTKLKRCIFECVFEMKRIF